MIKSGLRELKLEMSCKSREGRTGVKMWKAGPIKWLLVCSKLDKVCETEWYHSCQPRYLPVSHDTFVQEGNYFSHAKHPADDTQDISTQRSLQRWPTY